MSKRGMIPGARRRHFYALAQGYSLGVEGRNARGVLPYGCCIPAQVL